MCVWNARMGWERSSSSYSDVKTRSYQVFAALTPAGSSRHLAGASVIIFVLLAPGVKRGQRSSGGQILLSNLRGNSCVSSENNLRLAFHVCVVLLPAF